MARSKSVEKPMASVTFQDLLGKNVKIQTINEEALRYGFSPEANEVFRRKLESSQKALDYGVLHGSDHVIR